MEATDGTLQTRSITAQPATSVHLMFSNPDYNHRKFEKVKRNGWIVTNNVRVKETYPYTFFAVLQFPGVYAGIQHHPSKVCRENSGIIPKTK